PINKNVVISNLMMLSFMIEPFNIGLFLNANCFCVDILESFKFTLKLFSGELAHILSVKFLSMNTCKVI
ncbi:hypothetical protein, partial [Arsenophonus nasoniae]|uniref:hypothetical protein n=1 Tax=Arsenophonus nasoniae TaxID=638 RepID=UPI0038799DB8